MQFKKITSIKKIGKRRVYDISVKDNHNFIIGNLILSHNSETHGLVDGSQDFTIYGKTPSEEDRKASTDQLRRDGKITQKQVSLMADLEPGQYFVVESGKDAKLRYFLLPRTAFWRESHGDFYKIWAKTNGIHAFSDFSDLKKHIDDNFQIKFKELKDKEKEEKLERSRLSAKKKEIEEERRMREKLERERKYELEKKRMKEEVREKIKKEKELKSKPEVKGKKEEKPKEEPIDSGLDDMFEGW